MSEDLSEGEVVDIARLRTTPPSPLPLARSDGAVVHASAQLRPVDPVADTATSDNWESRERHCVCDILDDLRESVQMGELPERLAPPPSFFCSITCSAMLEPYTTADGQTYELTAIARWLQSKGPRAWTSPKTNAPLPSSLLIPNLGLKAAADEYVDGLELLLRSVLENVHTPRGGLRRWAHRFNFLLRQDAEASRHKRLRALLRSMTPSGSERKVWRTRLRTWPLVLEPPKDPLPDSTDADEAADAATDSDSDGPISARRIRIRVPNSIVPRARREEIVDRYEHMVESRIGADRGSEQAAIMCVSAHLSIRSPLDEALTYSECIVRREWLCAAIAHGERRGWPGVMLRIARLFLDAFEGAYAL